MIRKEFKKLKIKKKKKEEEEEEEYHVKSSIR
jgi:hypothetical protein